MAQRVGIGIALLFHDRGTRRGWVVSSTPRPHFTPGKDTVLILQEAEWAPGPVWKGGKSRPHWDSIPDRPDRSQSLYRLSYPAHLLKVLYNICKKSLSSGTPVRGREPNPAWCEEARNTTFKSGSKCEWCDSVGIWSNRRIFSRRCTVHMPLIFSELGSVSQECACVKKMTFWRECLGGSNRSIYCYGQCFLDVIRFAYP